MDKSKLKFFVLFSTNSEPTELELTFHGDRESRGKRAKANENGGQYRFEGDLLLPLPKFLVIFSLGEWPHGDDCQLMSAHVHIGTGLDPFCVGTLSKDSRALCWQGVWREDLQVRGYLMGDEGQSGLLVITPSDSMSTSFTWDDNMADQDLDTSSRNLRGRAMTASVNGLDLTADSVTTPKYALRRREEEVTPEVTEQLSKPPAVISATRKRRKTDRSSTGTPKGQSRVKRLQMQANSQSSSSSPSSVSSDKPSKEILVPSARWGHTTCAISKKQALVIGGQGEQQVLSRDSVWLLDTDKMGWCVPAINHTGNSKPQYRMGHTTVYDAKVQCVYVYGGSKNLRWYSDVHILDLESWRWSHVKASGRAPTRAYHTSNLFCGEMYVFGGVYPNPDPEPDGCSDTMYTFSPATESWYEPIVMGEKPRARSGHSATLLEEKLIIFGGWDAPECFNDVWCLDFSLMDYTNIEVNGTPPSPRSWHASAALQGKRILIQGGFNGETAMTDAFVFSLESKSWTKLIWPIPTTPTVGHTILTLSLQNDLVLSDDSDNKENQNTHTNANRQQKILSFGGGNNEGGFSNKLISFTLQLPGGSSSVSPN